MMRVADWRSRLNSELDRSRERAFVWGENDCTIFLGRCLEAITGENPALPFVGKYSTAAEAVAVIKSTGAKSLISLAAKHLEQIPLSMARVGDVAAFRSKETGWALGVIIGERVAVLRPDGLGTVHLSEAAKAYRVG